MTECDILVLLHERDTKFDSAGYLIKFLIREWEKRGFSVNIVRGVGQRRRAGVVIPHVNLTVRPRAYEEFCRGHPRVVNRRVVDISKSTISINLVRKDDCYRGPVIVKTDRNYGGAPERRLLPPPRFSFRRWAARAARVASRVFGKGPDGLPWRFVEHIPPTAYPVFPSAQDVPKDVFANRNLVVEKFLPEISDGFFSVRFYYFFGPASVSFLFRLKESGIVATAVDVEEVPTPAELEGLRNAMGFDYGKFDYVLRDGKVELFDVNPTPGTEALLAWGLRYYVAGRLAAGIRSTLSAS